MDYNHGTAATTPRAGTPDSDPIAPVSSHRGPNPFASPYGSMPASAFGSSTALQNVAPPRYFHSRRIVKGEMEKPWLEKKDPKEKWVTIIPLIGITLGVALSAFLIYEGLQTVTNYAYCPVYIDDFSHGFNSSVWTKEVELGGFGNGEFEVTTNTDENVFVKDGSLFIQPTLQDASLISTNGQILNLGSDCTSDQWYNCITSTNTTNGTIVNPVKSGRINTKKGATIRYGRVEVEAKLPAGDWLWPAIWMLPVNNTYGPWPMSGEIDIMESRGNNYTYPAGGNNIVSSTLHWGPEPGPLYDQYWQDVVKREALHTTYSDGFHKFGVEWSPKYIFTFIDTRLLQVLYMKFNEPFWQRAQVPLSDANGTRITNPWGGPNTTDSTPFDQDFYLILNVAVGGTNGWFADGVEAKPWTNAEPLGRARKDFWDAKRQWYPTWKDNSALEVRSVKMYQQTGYNGCKA